MKRILILFLLVSNHAAWGQWDWTPEYRSLTELEPQDFQTSLDFLPEYHSDLMTYVFLPEWQHRWLQKNYSFNMTFGSVSSKQFIVDRHLRLNHKAADWFEARVNYFDQQNLEDQQMHLYIEPVVWFQKWIGVSGYFEPDYQKRNDNIGYALLLKPADDTEIKVFYTDILFTRNDRNNLSDRLLEPLPKAYGAVARKVNEQEFYEAAVRVETPMKWNYPTSANLYQYYRTMVQLMGSRQVNPTLRLSVRLMADRLNESITSPSEAWLRDRVLGTLQATIDRLGPNERWSLIPGLHFAYRGYTAGSTGQATLAQILPQAWWVLPAFGEGEKEDTISIGWDIDMFYRWATTPSVIWEQRNSGWEHRLNFRYELKFGPNFSGSMMATFDINNITSGSLHIFQGGCGQLQILL